MRFSAYRQRRRPKTSGGPTGDVCAGSTPTPAYAPVVDVYETDESVTAVIDLLGVGADAADLTIERDSLTVKAQMAWSPPEGLQPLHG